MKAFAVIAMSAVALFVVAFPQVSHAQNLPVYSANGFKCSEAPLKGSSMNLVTCEGSFSGGGGNLTASGYASVGITQGRDGDVYSYSSLTGCLMHATAKSIDATDRKGKKQSFPAGDFNSANNHCTK